MSTAIELERVSKQLSGRLVPDDVTLTVKQGDIFGHLGPNGAGKTTTIRILLGLLEISGGVARMLGRHPREDAVRAKMGFLLDADGLYDGLTAAVNLAFYGELYREPGLALPADLPRTLRDP